jgi:hypothetical protein
MGGIGSGSRGVGEIEVELCMCDSEVSAEVVDIRLIEDNID